MQMLNALDLSSNKLSGDTPLPLAGLQLRSLNLSSNQLEGQVPAGLATAAYDRSFLDNPGLCLAGTEFGFVAGVRSCSMPSQAASSPGVRSTALLALKAAACVVVVLVVAVVFFVVHDRKKKRAAQDGSEENQSAAAGRGLLNATTSVLVYRSSYSLCQILTKDLTNKILMHVKKNYLIGFIFEHSF